MALNIQAVVSLDTRMFTAGIRGLEAQVNQFAGLAVMQFGGVAQQISAMWGAFGPVGGAITALSEVIHVGADYEQQMARVASYTGEVGEAMQKLSADGAEMASEFGFSLNQIGESMASLALAGVEAADMMDVLKPSLLLAGATLGDANQSAEAITSTLKVFQLEMNQATRVADQFAGAIASSPLDMQRLTDAMKYAGATGAAFGMQMEQVVAEIAAYHQVGQRGQMAGTAFRGALLEMSAAAAQAKGVVGAALRGWRPEIEGLTGAVRRLNDQGVDTSVVIQELGKRAGPGVAALMKFGADAMDDLARKVNENADAAKMYGIQMDTLSGQFKLFKGEIATLAQKIFDALTPGLRQSLSALKDMAETVGKCAAAVKDFAGPLVNTLLPAVTRLTVAWVAMNAVIKAFGAFGLAGGVTSFGGLLSKGRSNVAAQLAMVEALKGKNIALQNTVSALTQKQQQLAASIFVNQTAFAQGTLSAQKYLKANTLLGGQLGNVSQKITAANAAIAANAASMQAAEKAAASFTMGLGAMGATVAGIGALIGGVAVGRMIANMDVAGRTIEDHLAAAMNGGQVVSENELSPVVVQLQKDIAEWKKAGADAANEYIKGMMNSAEYTENLSNALKDVSAQSEATKASIEGIFGGRDVFGTATGGMFAEIDAVAKEIKEVFAGSGGELFGTQASQLQTAINNVGTEAKSLKDSILEKEREHNRALEEQKTLESEIATLEEKREQTDATLKSDPRRFLQDWKNSREYEIKNYDNQLSKLRELLEQRKENATATENALNGEIAKQAELVASLDLVKDKLAEVRGEAEEAARVAEQDAAAQKAEQFRIVAEIISETGLSMEAASTMAERLGANWRDVMDEGLQFGISAQRVGENVSWMAKNGEDAKSVLTNMGMTAGTATGLIIKFGKDCIEAARRIYVLGEAEDDLARNLGVLPEKAEEASRDTQKAVEEIVSSEKAIQNVATLSQSRITRITQNIQSLANGLAPLQNFNLNLSWLRDLAAMTKLPNLSGVTSFVKKFGELASGIAATAAQMAGVSLAWVAELAQLKLPDLGDVKGWKQEFSDWVDAIASRQAALESFASVMGKMNTAISGVGNATVTIAFKEGATLDRIEQHLGVLAGLKGVIWA